MGGGGGHESPLDEFWRRKTSLDPPGNRNLARPFLVTILTELSTLRMKSSVNYMAKYPNGVKYIC